MNKPRIYIIFLLISWPTCYAQDDFSKSFFDFVESSRYQFDDFSVKANDDFTRTLQDNWNEFKVWDARVRSSINPSSDTLRKACNVENCEIDISNVPVESVSSPNLPKSTDAADVYERHNNWSTQSSVVSFDYYGQNVQCLVPVGYANLRMSGESEKAVSLFWRDLSNINFKTLASSILKSCREMDLNDWALYEYVWSLSARIYPDEFENERAVFTIFCLNQLGMNCRVARTDDSLIPVFAAKQEIYGRSFFLLGNTKYYLDKSKENIRKIRTYSVSMLGADKDFDMTVMCSPKFDECNETICLMESSVFDKSLSIPINKTLISFYSDYPQLDVNIYATTEPSNKFIKATMDSFKSKLDKEKGVNAVNFLLGFVQNDFIYKTDIEQFGREKPFFCEENFYYQYNDCEDRAVLFSFLVRKLLRYECLLLEYADHINCAVAIDGDIEGYYVRRNNKRYYVCDPTCKGAKVGMSAKNYRIKPQHIWILY